MSRVNLAFILDIGHWTWDLGPGPWDIGRRPCMIAHMFQKQKFVVTTFALGLSLLLFTSVSAQSARERKESIRSSVESGKLSDAVAQLQAWRLVEPSLFAVNNFDYLLARLSEKTGDRANAAVNYQRVVARDSVLAQYGLWHLAQFARNTGNLTLEREQLRQLIATAPTSLLRNAADSRLATSFFESGDFASVIALLKPRFESRPIPATSRPALALLGQTYVANNQPDQARQVFNELISSASNSAQPDDYALAAVRGLDSLDSGGAVNPLNTAPLLDDGEHMRRAFVYHANRDFASARLHYTAVSERAEKGPSVPDALYQSARSYFQDSRYVDAIPFLKRLLDEYSTAPAAHDGLGLLAGSYARLGRTDEAITAYRQLIDQYPNDPTPERPYLNAIDALRDGGRDQDALAWIDQTRQRFKGKPAAALALFSLARVHLAQGAWSHALSDLEALRGEPELGGNKVPGGTSLVEITFLHAFALEQLGRIREAVPEYLSIPDGRSEYYGARATQRLFGLAAQPAGKDIVAAQLSQDRNDAKQAGANGQDERARAAAQNALRLTSDPATRQELIDVTRRAYSNLSAYTLPQLRLIDVGRQEIIIARIDKGTANATSKQIADELLFLGLYEEGSPELAASLSGAGSGASAATRPQSRDESYTLAVMYWRGDLADRAIAFAEPLWKNVPRDYLVELAPQELIGMLYPTPYSSIAIESAQPRGVDPRFVLSIARQESRYRSDAKSASAARGLMQFIPATANTIAIQLGKQSFRQDDLYDPHVALLFGSQYLSNLFKLFPDLPQAVAASYNGGEDNVARWVARSRSKEPDRIVPELGFAQTKDYVYKVMANFWTYQKLYDEQLNRR